ncbi:helix-turn-helix domain-containing protein [Kribbella swartbergensis]
MSTSEGVSVAPLLLTVEQAAQRLGIGRTSLYALVKSGEIESVPLGRLRRIPAECLDEYVARLRSQNRTATAA